MKLHLYVLRRLVLMLPTLLGITLVTFLIVNMAPGGPIEQQLQKIRFGSGAKGSQSLSSRGAQGVSQDVIEAIQKQYGFDKPVHERYWLWLKKITRFDFGESTEHKQPVMDVIVARFPVSLQFGVASFVLTYVFAVSLGLVMAYTAGRWTDTSVSFGLVVLSAIPAFAFAILLLVFLAGDTFMDIFPLGYLHSERYYELNWSGKIVDRLHHFLLPLMAYMVGSFTALAFLCRNSVLDEINKDYIRTARAVGVGRWQLYSRHAFRNALIPVVTGIGGFLAVFLTGSVLVESIFQLDGIGLLGYRALMERDYNMIMGLTFLQSLALLLGNLVGDLAYMLVDPRVDFARA